MKKSVIIAVIISLFMPLAVFAGTVKNFTLKKDSLYLLIIDDKAQNFKISNPNVVAIEVMDTIENNKEQILLHTISNGQTTFEVDTPSDIYQYNFTVNEQGQDINSDDLFEIEKPDTPDSGGGVEIND